MPTRVLGILLLFTAKHTFAQRHWVDGHQNYGSYPLLPAYSSRSPAAPMSAPSALTTSPTSDLETSSASSTTFTASPTTTENAIPVTNSPTNETSVPFAQATFFVQAIEWNFQLYVDYIGFGNYGSTWLVRISPHHTIFTLNEQGNLVLIAPGLPEDGFYAQWDRETVPFVRPGSPEDDPAKRCKCSIDQDTLELTCDCNGWTRFCFDRERLDPVPLLGISICLADLTPSFDGWVEPLPVMAVPTTPTISAIPSSTAALTISIL
ncbi:hypothetical protein PFICI_03723 [Pestalotiopsis fici W106-1]|uniref:Uncharacterized protein n=1 Tax=Pestalotiopsis fici (strain W106-1 / CGMCC3.15140) TaxID=1229662 RepID=W3XI04_PESFW|nr:uncharacterized protein PFICI_03723 [Pestalotiopsis fici W106-1]ETS85698.1 hypothetical protein PFICI_03723 [Pestalotiopsis fici W106-1]